MIARMGRVDVRREAGIAWVTIHNEAKLNTLNSSLMKELAAAIEGLDGDDTLRAVILTGAGKKAFCGGADIDEMAQLSASTAEAFITRLHLCCELLRRLPVPVIGRVDGYALGAGLEILASCDLRVATETSVFGMPEVKLGIPSVVEAALLPGLVGWGRAREILLLGENFSAAEAAAWGMVEKVVASEDLDRAVERWIEAILRVGPRAIRIQKELIRKWEDLPLRDAILAGIPAFVEAHKGDEPRTMMQEFQRLRARRKV